MKNLEQQFSEGLLITPSTNSVREYSNQIPVNLLIEIFSRVPAKSIGRFRCLSKFWKSIFRRPDFTELFLTKSTSRPRLFFAFTNNEETFVFSSPQPQNLDDEDSSLVASPYKYSPISIRTGVTAMSATLRGLVFLQWGKKARVIYNPVTGESLTLPKVKASSIQKSYFGFDPISKQYKVLCMTESSRYGTLNTHHILTLGTGKRFWRTIQDPMLPNLYSMDICINGVLYYQGPSCEIVCFDFRFEKFSSIKLDKDMEPFQHFSLFNYKGKLVVHQNIDIDFFRGKKQFTLWVLEDAGKHKWSKRICVFPSLWENIVNENRVVGMTSTGEIVFSPYMGYLLNPFYIYFYNIERNTFTRVIIQGFEHRFTYVHIFLDYVENIYMN